MHFGALLNIQVRTHRCTLLHTGTYMHITWEWCLKFIDHLFISLSQSSLIRSTPFPFLARPSEAPLEHPQTVCHPNTGLPCHGLDHRLAAKLLHTRIALPSC